MLAKFADGRSAWRVSSMWSLPERRQLDYPVQLIARPGGASRRTDRRARMYFAISHAIRQSNNSPTTPCGSAVKWRCISVQHTHRIRAIA